MLQLWAHLWVLLCLDSQVHEHSDLLVIGKCLTLRRWLSVWGFLQHGTSPAWEFRGVTSKGQLSTSGKSASG